MLCWEGRISCQICSPFTAQSSPSDSDVAMFCRPTIIINVGIRNVRLDSVQKFRLNFSFRIASTERLTV